MEEGLRRDVSQRGDKYERKPGLTSLNVALAEDGADNSLVHARIGLRTAMRNSADHGESADLRIFDARERAEGVAGFMADHPR